MPESGRQRRRDLRANATVPEILLWWLLRSRQLDAWKFRRQHPVGPYILDFYCHEARLAIELDGGQHFEPHVQRYDAWRTSYLRAGGIRVLRFTNDQVLGETDAVLEVILAALAASPSPRPSPPQTGERE